MNPHEPHPRGSWRLDLVEVVAIVVGYGLAAVLFRAFWPSTGLSPRLGVFAVGLYAWLGLAMSGPLLLLRRPPVPAAVPGEAPLTHQEAASPQSWAEVAWMIFGVYWIVMGVLVLPIRLHSFRFSDTILFGAVPLATAATLRLFGPRAEASGRRRLPWTHHAAVALIVTWPAAWLCLIVLGEAMLSP